MEVPSTGVLERIGAMVTRRVRRVLRPTIIRHRGVRLAVDARVLSPTMVGKLYEGGYETAEADLVRTTLTPDDRVLELGGGVGFIGIIAARVVRHPHQVLIIEANAQLIPLMELNFRLNGVTRSFATSCSARTARERSVFSSAKTFGRHLSRSSRAAVRPRCHSRIFAPS